ncbi:MAG: TetR family transcriptional regulator [Actinomycetes bacterium]
MPRIETQTLAQHRDWRRHQLINAAASIAMESGGAAISVSAVAQRAGMSRTSVYEYFASSADLVADLIIEELDNFAKTLESAVGECSVPCNCIELWIDGALRYIADGRHLLAKALNATALPQDRAAQIGTAHRALLAPLSTGLATLGIKDIARALAFIQATTDVATKRIEAGHDAEAEIKSATAFCINGLAAL